MSTTEDNLEVNQHFLTSVESNQSESFQKPKFPQYAVHSKRAESFKTWPENHPLKPDVLIEAGLVYTGVGDSVRCYHCGGGLRNWEADDSPWEEHAKWYPSCPHVLQEKGQHYVDMLTRAEKPVQDEPRAEVQTHTPKEDLIKSDAAQSCVQNGFSENLVKRAIDIFIQTHNGNTDFKGADLCEILLDLDESTIPSELSACSNVADTHTNVSMCDTQDEDEASIMSPDNLKKLLPENQKLKESMCEICLDDFANVIFRPCGHMVSCPQCASALNKCPICRNTVKFYVKA